MGDLNLRKYFGIVLFFLFIYLGQFFVLNNRVELLFHFGIFRVIPEILFIYSLKGTTDLIKNKNLLLGLSSLFVLIYLITPFNLALFAEQCFIDLIIIHVIIVIKNPIQKNEWIYLALILGYFVIDILSITMRK